MLCLDLLQRLQHDTNNATLVVSPPQWRFLCTTQNHINLRNKIKLLPVTREHVLSLLRGTRWPHVIYICVISGNTCSLPVTRLSLRTSLPFTQPKKAKGCVTIVTTALDTSEQGVKIENTHYTACIPHLLVLLSALHLCTHMQDCVNERMHVCLFSEFMSVILWQSVRFWHHIQ